MSRSVRISLKAARSLLWSLTGHKMPVAEFALAELRAGVRPKKGVVANKVRKVAKKATKKAKTQSVRAEVMKRAGDVCEVCATPGTNLNPLELDHFEGRARSETLETCWALCRMCHRRKTENYPTRVAWLSVFAAHCHSHKYSAQARNVLRQVEAEALVLEASALTRGAP